MSVQPVSSTCGLRIVVGHLGEKSQSGWWDTAFLNPTGFRYAGLVYPKTAASACVTSASEAACRAHDERIGKGRVVHLFRLPGDAETKLRSELSRLSVEDLLALCSKEAALDFLDQIADGAKAANATGPVQLGTLKEMNSQDALRRLAAAYAAGFRTGIRVFPYFA